MPIGDYSPQTGQHLRDDNTKWNQADHWSVLRSPFQEQKSVELTNIIELKSIYGISVLRDSTTTTGSASVTHMGDEFRLRVTSTGDSAILDSAERGRYVPGYGAEAGIGVRTDSTTLPSSGQVERWGYYDDRDGFYFGRSSTGLFVGVRARGSTTVIGRSNFTGDPLDGTGPSGMELDPSAGHIYQIDFSWYGYGVIEWKVFVSSTDARQRSVTLHRHQPSGETSVPNPNLPIRAEVTTGSTGTDDLFVAGRKFAVVGKFIPNRRKTAERRTGRTGLSSTQPFVPLVSFRRKEGTTGDARFESASVKVGAFEIITDTDVFWQIRTGGTLSSTAWQTPSEHSASETTLEAENQSTGITGGEVLDAGLLSGGAKNNRTDFGAGDPLDFDFTDRDPVSLCVRPTTGTGAVTSCVFSAREEW